MSRLIATFLRGLGVVLPVVLTVWLVVWAVQGIETILREVFLWFFSEQLYQPGLGVAMAVAVIFIVGILVQVFVLRQVWAWLESVFERIPLVKTVYNGIRDFLAFFSSNLGAGMSTVVLVDIAPGAQLVGFVTDRQPPFAGLGEDGMVAVYLPMSYMVGGYTLLLPADRIHECDMSIEQAMRYTLTAGIQAKTKA